MPMRLRLPKYKRLKLPYREDQIPLKTKDKLEEHLQAAISFLQTQQSVLHRTLDILEEMAELAESGKKQTLLPEEDLEEQRANEKQIRKLGVELKWLATLEFNKKRLFSGDKREKSFKLFKGAGPKAPRIKQHPVKSQVEDLSTDENVDATSIRKRLSALYEMLGQTDAAEKDLQTSFEAFVADPSANSKLKFIEPKVKTWVSEIIARTDGLSVQAHVHVRQVDALMRDLGKLLEK
jgi:flagellin-like hook-associated protein FlgL